MWIIKNSKSGMTLIELLIVLALLTGLASMALVSMGDLSARSRYDITVDRMEKIQAIVAGDGLNTGRFIADMGRLPKAHILEKGQLLNELWNKPLGVPAYKTKSLSIDPAPAYFDSLDGGTLQGGWMGPYFQPVGDALFDGFGNDFSTTGTASISNIIFTGKSSSGTSWYDKTLTNNLSFTANARLTVDVHVINTNASPATWASIPQTAGLTNCAIRLVVPDVDGAQFDKWKNPVSGFTTTASQAQFSGIVPGPRVLVAWAYRAGSGGTNGWWSGYRTIDVRPGAQHVDLYLQQKMEPK